MKKKKKRNRNKKNPETKIIDINLHRFNGDLYTLRCVLPEEKYEEQIKKIREVTDNDPNWTLTRFDTD